MAESCLCCFVVEWGGTQGAEELPRFIPETGQHLCGLGFLSFSQEVQPHSHFFPSLTQKSIIEPERALLSFGDKIVYIYKQYFEAYVLENG